MNSSKTPNNLRKVLLMTILSNSCKPKQRHQLDLEPAKCWQCGEILVLCVAGERANRG